MCRSLDLMLENPSQNWSVRLQNRLSIKSANDKILFAHEHRLYIASETKKKHVRLGFVVFHNTKELFVQRVCARSAFESFV